MPRKTDGKRTENWEGRNHDAAIPRSVKLFVKSRADDRCQNCGIGVLLGTGHIDHIIPLRDNGEHATRNLQYLCRNCHTHKTNEEASGRAASAKTQAHLAGFKKSKGRSFNRIGPKPSKLKSRGHWVAYTCEHTGVTKSRWVPPGNADDNGD